MDAITGTTNPEELVTISNNHEETIASSTSLDDIVTGGGCSDDIKLREPSLFTELQNIKVEYWPNGVIKYEGQYVENRKHGIGTFWDANG
jgi:antitoxin component YwqK of YwqJK toxin-antitoxin module